MQVVPRTGVWLPDELVVLQTAFGMLRNAAHRGLTDQEFETMIAADLVQSAHEGCYDPRELAQRCRLHINAELALRTAHSSAISRRT